jgi:cell division protein FtsB
MHDFQQRKKFRKRLYSRGAVIALAIMTVLLLRGVIGVLQKERESQKNVEEVSLKLEEARARDEELSQRIASIQTTSGVEREIRERYSVSKEGEEVVVLVEKEGKVEGETATSKGVWSSIKAWFGGLFDGE